MSEKTFISKIYAGSVPGQSHRKTKNDQQQNTNGILQNQMLPSWRLIWFQGFGRKHNEIGPQF